VPKALRSVVKDGVLPNNPLDPTINAAFEAMGNAHDLQQWQAVVDVGDAWYEARGGMAPTAATWYAQALQGVGRYEEAVPWAGVAAKQMPKDEPIAQIAAWSTYAQALARIGHYERARTAMTTAISIKADHAETTEKQGHMLAVLAMTARKDVVVQGSRVSRSQLWPTAWAMMESRLGQEDKQLPPGFRLWDGVTKEPVAVMHEQGLGDAVLSARWIPALMEATGHPVTYYGPKILAPWIATIPGVIMGDFDTPVPQAAIRAMSLLHHAHMTSPKDIPAPFAPNALLQQRAYRSRSGSVRVGVCWKGATIGWHNFERSYTPDQFGVIYAPLSGVEFVNLAHETDVDGLGAADFRDVMHTGEVVADLDLVVTVDTGLAHIAGSLGVPTLVIPPTVPDWRWVWPRGTETPFYPSITVCRRKRADDTSVLHVARRLTEQYAQAIASQRS
jgi:tetratricopeptide (TPR) repeat protein